MFVQSVVSTNSLFCQLYFERKNPKRTQIKSQVEGDYTDYDKAIGGLKLLILPGGYIKQSQATGIQSILRVLRMIYIFIDAPNGAHGLLTSHIKFLHNKKIFFFKKKHLKMEFRKKKKPRTLNEEALIAKEKTMQST